MTRTNRYVKPSCSEECFVACHLTVEGAGSSLSDLSEVATEAGDRTAVTSGAQGHTAATTRSDRTD